MIEIEDGIPIPTKRNPAWKYPWTTMKVGQSFFVAGKSHAHLSYAYVRQKDDRKFQVARVEGGVRVWRVA